MAEVLKGFDIQNTPPTPIAIKLFSNTTIEQNFIQEAFQRETVALKALEHPNIVKYYSSGFDEKNTPYIIMEWLPISTTEWINRTRESFETWDDFYDSFVKPIAKAVAYACNQKIAHRDLKPSNLRFDAQGQMRLIDFSICIHDTLTSDGDRTLGGFKTQRFAPSNPEWLVDSFRRDVYGLAAMCTFAMAEWQQIDSRMALNKILDKLAIPEEFRCFFSSILHCDGDAPLDAEDMLRRLESLQANRVGATPDKIIGLTLTKKIAWTIVRDGFTADAILKDLNGHAFIAFHGNREKRADGTLKLYGEEFEYSVKTDKNDPSRLFVIGVRRPSEMAVFQNSKERAFTLRTRFTFHAFPPARAANLDGILDEMREQEAENERKHKEREERRLEDALFEIVATKQKLIFGIGRMDFSKTGKANTISVPQLKNVKIDVQNLVVKLYSSGGKFLYKGKINPAEEDYRFTTDYTENLIIPTYGTLDIDKDYERKVIESQKETLKQIFSYNAKNPRMGELLKDPGKIHCEVMTDDIHFNNPKLDKDKQDIIRKFLGADEVCLVEGPPGTGKTDLIIEAIRQQLTKDSQSRILVVSQTNVALDNIIERIPDSLDIVRIGDERNDKISRQAKPFLVSACLDGWGEALNEKCEQFVINWATSHDINPSEIKLCSLLWRYISELEDHQKEQAAYDRAYQQLTERPFDDEALRLEREQKDTLRQSDKSLKHTERSLQELDKNGMAWLDDIKNSGIEAAKSLVSDFLDEGDVRLGKHLLELNEDWRMTFARSQEFKETFVLSKQIVFSTCMALDTSRYYNRLQFDLVILDEASKAGMLDSITPLARGRKWLLVGDRNQLPPFVDEDLKNDCQNREDAFIVSLNNTSLFQYLFDLAPEPARGFLSTQYRMSPGIASLVSRVFYDDNLKSATTLADNDLAAMFGRELIWINTSNSAHRRDRRSGRSSFDNEWEAAAVENFAMELERTLPANGRPIKVLIMSGYNAQVKLIKEKLQKHSFQRIVPQVNSIDACQGKESDIVMLSITRSNQEQMTGFMSQKERLNVALSRGKKLLIIIGDLQFATLAKGFVQQVAEFVQKEAGIASIRIAR